MMWARCRTTRVTCVRFAAGATGYVLKEAADVEVVAAVREVARGGRYVHRELGARLIAAEAPCCPSRSCGNYG